MKRKQVMTLISLALLHTIFMLSTFGVLGDVFAIQRILMLIQFLPLIAIINNHELLENKFLLFLSFAVCVSTLYIVDDFHTGFYGAVMNHESGLVPRMRTSAHLMAYQDTGRLVVLDYHAEYFLGYAVVHFLSEVTSLNYILVYALVIRVLAILMWSIIFIWASTRIRGANRRIWFLILALSILMASQGYNSAVSFAPVLLLTLYMIVTRDSYTYEFSSSALIIALAMLLASFRETLLLALISLVMVAIWPLCKRIGFSESKSKSSLASLNFTLLVLALGRTLQFSSHYYFESYVNRILAVTNSIWAALNGEWMFTEEPLVTLSGIGNPVDRTMGLLSVVSALSFLGLLAILSLGLLMRKRNFAPLFFAFLLVYLLGLALPQTSYIAGKIVGSGTTQDFSSATVFARSMAPLAVLAIIPYFKFSRHARAKESQRWRRLLMTLTLICLSLMMILAPFWFFRGEVKSSYDMIRVSGDKDDAVAVSNAAYNFIAFRIGSRETVAVGPNSQFFRLNYLLVLKYRIGDDKVVTSVKGDSLARVYDNGAYVVTYHTNSRLLLEELTDNRTFGG